MKMMRFFGKTQMEPSVSLAVLIFNSLCISSEASHSELLFVASFTYSVTGFYFFLNGVLNRSSPSARQPTITLVSQLLLYHSVGGLVFLLGGAYTLAQHLSVPLALVSGVLNPCPMELLLGVPGSSCSRRSATL
ncbi:uncharacterized protein ISCGN_021357 [Ixodes scapularis]